MPEKAIAIGLSEARRAGVKVPAPKKGTAPEATRHKAQQDLKAGAKGAKKTVSRTRSKATTAALKKEGHSAASSKALSRQAKSAAAKTRAKKAPAKKSAARKSAARKSS